MTRIQKIQSNNLSYRFGGILDCVDSRNLNEAEISALLALKEDSRIIAGRMISSYAKAALDVLDIEKLKPDVDDIDAQNLIKAWS